MKKWLFNEHEHEAFQQLIWDGFPFAALVYMMELRPHMDAATCIVGDRRKVSHAGICEMLERHSKRGSHAGTEKKRDRYYAMRQIQALEDYGLVVRLPKLHRNAAMRLKLVLADTGSFRPQEERTMSALRGAHNDKKQSKDCSGVDSSGVDGCSGGVDSVDNSAGAHNQNTVMSAQHQDKDLYTYNIRISIPQNDCLPVTQETRSRTPGDGYLIAPDWVPDDLLVTELRREFGFPVDFIRERALLFRMQATERSFIRKSWRESFRTWVRSGVAQGFAEYQGFFNE